MKVKICGLNTQDAVEAANEAGVDFIGLVFAPSKRQVTIEEATQLRKLIADSVQVVGVFKDQPFEEVQAAIEKVPLDIVQLHGKESVDFCKKVPVPVIKAFSIEDQDKRTEYEAFVEHILIDSPLPGSGELFEWERLAAVSTGPVFLAGGLTSENVQQAIEQVNPYGVDVSSGVETDGVKDPTKIKQFIQQVRGEEG